MALLPSHSYSGYFILTLLTFFLILLFVACLPTTRSKLYRQDLYVCSLMHLIQLEQCLAHSRCLTSMLNEYVKILHVNFLERNSLRASFRLKTGLTAVLNFFTLSSETQAISN